MTRERIALIGFGEVGRTLAADLENAGIAALTAWDRLFPSEASDPSRAAARCAHVAVASDMRTALHGSTFIISAVTAAECLAAAREAAGAIGRDAVYLDLNSVSPETKRGAARVIEQAGARYVEAAVMSPIAPKRIATSILLGGPHAAEFASRARAHGFAGSRVFDATVGPASAAKMCRSVIVKGLEALVAESLLTARRYGVDGEVLASLGDLFPGDRWEARAAYMISRSLEHGARRAAEMREAAATVADAGLEPWMSNAAAQRQEWAAAHAPGVSRGALDPMLDELLRAIPFTQRNIA